MDNEITADRLRKIMDYDPETGVFTYRSGIKGHRAGSRAGSVAKHGYRVMVLGGKTYMALRLAWLHVHGVMPPRNVKPRNGIKDDCRLANLGMSPHDMGTKSRKLVRGAHRYSDLKRNFGLTPSDYGAMLAAQGGVCAICAKAETATRAGSPKWLAVDHDHVTGQVRGLLCQSCNLMVGYARDDVKVLIAGAEYLRRHGASNAVMLRSA